MKNKVLDKKRVEYIDLAKGLTMILVILGHTLPYGELRGAIYSFHMPIFFVLSCITFRFSNNNDEFVQKTEKAFKHLIIPAFFTFLITQFAFPIINYHYQFNSLDYILRFLQANTIALIFSSGVNVNILSTSIFGIDVPWFLVVLFFGRSLFDYLHLKLSKNKLIISVFLFSVLGFCFSKVQWLPFSFDIVLVIMPLFLIGSVFYKFNVENKPFLKFLFFGVLWAVTLLIRCKYRENYFELATRNYPLYPLCLITAIAGTLMMVEFSVILMKLKKVMTPVLYLGKNSLYMIIIHTVERYWFKGIWVVSQNVYINFIYRLMLNISIFMVVMAFIKLIKIVKKKLSV